jgi:isocitrate lyase
MPSQQPVRPYVAALGARTGSFDEVALAITGGESETTALAGSTEESQF